jgi:hypothetical protein
MFCADDPKWSWTKTADEIGMSQQWVSKHVVSYEERQYDPEIWEQPNLSTAHSKAVVSSDRRRKAERDGPAAELKDVHWGDFIKWAKAYKGPRFNFLHCDFPYGINTHKRQQGNAIEVLGGYDDSPDIYWTLLKALCDRDNLDRICATSAHIMFWFSMKYYHETLEYFREHSDFKIDPFPLIWMKEDKRGIVSEPMYGPRRIYETCLFGRRGDHKILTPVANAIAHDTVRWAHPSVKPEPVLRHFFRMFVDENTRMLDPTCGSGTALCAAEYHDATQILGIEIKEDDARRASAVLETARREKRDSTSSAKDSGFNGQSPIIDQ